MISDLKQVFKQKEKNKRRNPGVSGRCNGKTTNITTHNKFSFLHKFYKSHLITEAKILILSDTQWGRYSG